MSLSVRRKYDIPIDFQIYGLFNKSLVGREEDI